MIKSSPHHLPFTMTTATVFLAFTALIMTGCSYSNSKAVSNPLANTVINQSPAVQAVIGDYASDSYAKRAQGYDWVGVIVTADAAGKGDQINIKVRARSDIKKPTCTFDGHATLMGQDHAHGIIFQSTVNNSMAFFQFKNDKLTIDSQDKYALNSFCSGGGSIVGEYQKLEGDLNLH